VAIADIDKEGLIEVGKVLVKIVGEANVIVMPTDVSKTEDVIRFRDRVYEAWSEVRINVSARGTHWQSIVPTYPYPSPPLPYPSSLR